MRSLVLRQVRVTVTAGVVLMTSSCGGDDIAGPTVGSIEISTATSGPEPDTDGYVVRVDAGSETAIGANATLQHGNLGPGTHTVHLTGLAPNCALEGDNPRRVEVQPGDAISVDFVITCAATTGGLEVTTTTGASADPDGYVILVDGAERGPIGATGGVGIDQLPPGDHLVGLSGVAGNCRVEGDNPRTVTVTAGSSVSVAFAVTCEAPSPGAGSLRIVTATTGQDADPDGYAFAVDEGSPQPIGSNAATIVANVPAGNHTVQLSGTAGNCALQGTNPRSATVAAGATAELRFAITCTATSGSLEVTTTTTGSVPDPDGYTVSVDGGGPQPIATDGSISVPRLAPGAHQVSLGGLAANCSVDGQNPRPVTIVLGQTASLRFTVSCPAAASVYRAIDLLEAPSLATGINSAGQIVGSFETSNGCNHAFLWQNGVVTDLGTLGGCETSATAINSAGQVVGQSQTVAGDRHAFRWENGVMTDLGTLGGEWSGAWDINDAGQVVGTSQTSDPSEQGAAHAFLWQSGAMTDLGNLGGPPSEAADINSASQVVGAAATLENQFQSGETHAFLWERGTMTDLGTLGGDFSRAAAINTNGLVVGESVTAGGETRAFVWENDVMTELGTLGGNRSQGSDINDAGQVVGWSTTESGESRATLWIRE